MKVLKRQISTKDGDGFVQMKTEEAEDMWHAYNLIMAGDRVRTTTVRKVQCSFFSIHALCCAIYLYCCVAFTYAAQVSQSTVVRYLTSEITCKYK